MKTKEILLGVAMLFIGAFSTYLFGIIKSKNDNSKRFIEYKLDKNKNVFSKPNISNKKISILLDDKPVEQLSRLSVPFFNMANNTDLKDLKIYFELHNPNGDSIKLVNATAIREDNITDGIQTINVLNPSSEKKGVKKGYSISSLNRREDGTPSFTADFYFEGSTFPECNVFIDQPDVKDQPGVEARLFDISNFTHWYDSPWFILPLIVLIYLLVVYVVIWIFKKASKKSDKSKRLERENEIINQLKGFALTNKEAIAKEIIFLGELYDYQHAGRFSQFFSQLEEPIRKSQTP